MKVDSIKFMWINATECIRILYPSQDSPVKRRIRPELKKFVSDNKELLNLVEVDLVDPSYELVDLRVNRVNGAIGKGVDTLGDKSKYYILMDEDGTYNMD